MSEGPLLVVGLDGATFDLIGPMAARGELPALARLMAEGAWGPLRSTIPPVSPQAWSSFLTGVYPGQHGVLGFQGPAQGRFYRRPILSSRDIGAPTLLRIAGEAGHRVAAMGVPMTYPPEVVNGVLVPEQHGPPLSHPPALWAELVAAVGDPRDQASHVPYLFTQDKRGYAARQLELLEVQRRAAHWLLDREAYDLAVVAFVASDRAAHFLWKDMDPGHPDHRPEWAAALGDALPALYRRLDAIIGELWARLGPGGTLLVMSDHGFGPLHTQLNINRWLCQQGLLVQRSWARRLATVSFPRLGLRLFNAAARRLGLPHRALPLDHWEKPIDPALYHSGLFVDSHLLINWPHTQVYCGTGSEYGLHINLRGREPRGIVAPGAAYESLCQQVCQALPSLIDPGSGLPVVRRVWRREELYSGPWLERAPDLILELREGFGLSADLLSAGALSPALHRSGNHRPLGICLLAGPAIRPGALAEPPSIVDLAPTLLHLLGVPVPASMAGRVLDEVLDPTWSAGHPVRQISWRPAGDLAAQDEPAVGLSPEEAARVETHLRGLGYIE